MTLKQHNKRLVALLGVVAAVPSALAAFLSPYLPDSLASLRFPPLGDQTLTAKMGILVFSVVIVQLLYFWKGGKWLMGLAAMIAITGFVVYMMLSFRFCNQVRCAARGNHSG
jgi:hypothetical protein